MPTSPARPEMRCPRRDAFIDRISPGPDAWRDDRTCSCCGSIHPDDFMTLARSGEAEIGPTDKRYKAYVEGGEFRNPRKFYFQHLDMAQREEFVRLYNARPRRIYTDVGAFTIPTDGPQSGMALGYPGHFYALPFFMVVL